VAGGALDAGKAAVRRFWRPFVLIQLVAVALVAAYHLDARVRAACAALAAWKTAGGLPLSAASAALAGGILPELAKLATAQRRAGGPSPLRGRGGEIAFNVAFFAFNGVVVDGLYRLLARLFGTGTGLGTILSKMAFDQFVFTPPWLVLITALYLARARGFRWAALRADFSGGFRAYARARVVPLLLPDWLFWIPMVCAVYAFPLPLQFLLFTLALAAWSLVLVVIATGEPAAGKAASGQAPTNAAPAAEAARAAADTGTAA
jgi:hypothetical protein